MKKCLFLIIIISLAGCSSILKRGDKDPMKKVLSGPDMEIYKITEKNDWAAFSYGLFYKNLGIESGNAQDGNKYLNQAVVYFLESAGYGINLDRIYFQLSETYYYLKELDKSLDYAKKAIQIDKTNLTAYSRIFNIYNDLEMYAKAVEIYEDFLKIDPDAIHIYFVLGEYYYKKLNDFKKAEMSFQKVIEISGRTSVEDYYRENSYFSMGYMAYRSKNSVASIEYFTKVRDMNHNNINAAYMLAVLYMDVYDLKKSEENAEIYLKKIPDNLIMNSIMGRIKYINDSGDTIRYLRAVRNDKSFEGLLASGLYSEIMMKDDEAEKYLRALIKYRNDYLSPHVALAKIEMRKSNTKGALAEYITSGVIAYRNKLYAKAREYFNEALKIDDTLPELYFYLGRSYEELDNLSLAILNYKKVNDIKPSIDLLIQIGYLYFKKNDFDLSFKYFDRAIEMEPENSKPYFLKGLSMLRANKYLYAEVNIKKAISLNEKNEDFYFYLAIVLEKQEKLDEAIQTLEKAIIQDPKSARSYNYLGYIYADRNIKIDRSFILIRKALEIEPKNGAFLDSLGWVYFRKGEFKLALEKLLEAEKELNLSKSPDPVVYDHIGDVLERIGDRKNAVNYWKKSLEIKKDPKIEEKIIKIEKARD